MPIPTYLLPTTVVGRNDASANGSLRSSDFQCQLSGDESEGSDVATRPKAALQVSPKQPYARTDFLSVLHLRSSRSWPPAPGQERSYDRLENRRADDRFQSAAAIGRRAL